MLWCAQVPLPQQRPAVGGGPPVMRSSGLNSGGAFNDSGPPVVVPFTGRKQSRLVSRGCWDVMSMRLDETHEFHYPLLLRRACGHLGHGIGNND